MHAFTVDLEEWFCSHNLSSTLMPEDWHKLESRIESQTEFFLNLFSRHKVKASFFVLGWVAKRHPELIQTIRDEGHEIGSHGYAHIPLWHLSPEDFRKDLIKSGEILKTICGEKPRIHRAPAFSIIPQTHWAIDILEEEGYEIDSSIYPLSWHPEYGQKNAPLLPYPLLKGLKEYPLSCLNFGKLRIPVSGGAYFRFMPYGLYRNFIRKLEKSGRKLNFYIHPWEIDEGIPKLKGLPVSSQIRHYTALSTVKYKLEKLLNDFQFGTLSES